MIFVYLFYEKILAFSSILIDVIFFHILLPPLIIVSSLFFVSFRTIFS